MCISYVQYARILTRRKTFIVQCSYAYGTPAPRFTPLMVTMPHAASAFSSVLLRAPAESAASTSRS
ncbi:hypothetical protein EV291_10953 [Rhizobium sp. BK068]|nr:hypothetical protein EV291_10953 [Rhizobium sp. BK068]